MVIELSASEEDELFLDKVGRTDNTRALGGEEKAAIEEALQEDLFRDLLDKSYIYEAMSPDSQTG